LKDFVIKSNILLENINACAAPDRAPSMVGHYWGCLVYLKTASPGIFTFHCLALRQYLVIKALSVKLHASLKVVIQEVNKIRANAKN
jgi:hypothetical protein